MLQNPQLHYLDNAATTIVAPEVADVIGKAQRHIDCARPGRTGWKGLPSAPAWPCR